MVAKKDHLLKFNGKQSKRHGSNSILIRDTLILRLGIYP